MREKQAPIHLKGQNPGSRSILRAQGDGVAVGAGPPRSRLSTDALEMQARTWTQTSIHLFLLSLPLVIVTDISCGCSFFSPARANAIHTKQLCSRCGQLEKPLNSLPTFLPLNNWTFSNTWIPAAPTDCGCPPHWEREDSPRLRFDHVH